MECTSEKLVSDDDGGFLHVGGKKQLFYCAGCQRDITMLFRARCAECSPTIDLCADCFSVGVTALSIDCDHKPSHKYRIVDCIDTPIFNDDWTAAEELLVLEGIEKFGMGNWKAISDYICDTKVYSKTAKQVEENYWEHFMGRFGRCLPIPAHLQGQEEIDNYLKSHDISEEEVTIPVSEGHVMDELVVRDLHKQNLDKAALRERHALLPGADLPGFMPLREDFDVEYENDAEALLADMDFTPDDHPGERELKLQIIRIYNAKLAERDARKRFVIDRGLVDFKKQQTLEKRRSKEEKEIVSRLRMFSRFHSHADHEALVEGLIKARKLRKQIDLFQHYRHMGIRTLEDARQYESERKRRESEQKNQKAREVTPYLFENGRNGSGGAGSSGASGSGTSSSRNSRGGRVGRGGPVKEEGGFGGNGDASKTSLIDCNAVDENGISLLSVSDVNKAPGADHLGSKEIELCRNVPMLPMHYLAAKDAIVREMYRNGEITKEGIQRTVKVDEAKSQIIFDFFVTECQRGMGPEAESLPAVGSKRSLSSES